ncbi:SLC5/6 family protein [Flindersiella endophytica]
MRWGIIIPIFLYLLVLAGIGAWAFMRRRQAAAGSKSAEYYIGSRSLGWGVLVFTLLATAASAGTFIGGPGLVYQGGYGWVLVSIFQVPTAFVALSLLGKKFAILSRKLNAITVTDFLKHRYENPAVVVLASLGIVLFLTSYMIPQFVGGARVLQAVTGVDYNVLLFVFAGVVMLYTAFGGFLADAVNDTLQGIIMFVGGIVVWIVLLSAAGGMGPVNDQVMRTHPELYTLPGPGGFTAQMVASYSFQLGLMFCVLPHLAVRAMSYRDSKAVHTAMSVGPIIMTVITLGFLTMGLVARFFEPSMQVGDLALPTTLVDVLPEGVAGALFAAPLAAIMSTVDSMILVISGAIVRDVIAGYARPAWSDDRVAKLGPIVSLALGGVVLLLAYEPPPYLEYLIIYAIGGLEVVFFVPLIGGLYWRRGNALGAALAMVGGMTWYIVANQWVPALKLGMFPIVTSSVVAVVLYALGSLLGPKPRREVLVKFWGTQRAIDQLAATTGGDRVR